MCFICVRSCPLASANCLSLRKGYTSCLFSMLLKEEIVDIEKSYGICSLTFVVDEFSGLSFHPSIFSAIHSRSG